MFAALVPWSGRVVPGVSEKVKARGPDGIMTRVPIVIFYRNRN
jgi:hypothetical protein